jgi:hypothetical protein
MNDKKLAANRKNARKSTGPKTVAGKAASSRNAIKHAVLAASPVLPGLESPEEWDGHRAGIHKGNTGSTSWHAKRKEANFWGSCGRAVGSCGRAPGEPEFDLRFWRSGR